MFRLLICLSAKFRSLFRHLPSLTTGSPAIRLRCRDSNGRRPSFGGAACRCNAVTECNPGIGSTCFWGVTRSRRFQSTQCAVRRRVHDMTSPMREIRMSGSVVAWGRVISLGNPARFFSRFVWVNSDHKAKVFSQSPNSVSKSPIILNLDGLVEK